MGSKQWYGRCVPTTLAEIRKSNDEFYAWRFPTQYAIENLERELRQTRERIAEMQSAGQTGNALDTLKFSAVQLSGEIEQLRGAVI